MVEHQKNFLEVLRKDRKHTFLSNFIESYNLFFAENSDLVQEEETQKELLVRLDKLYHSLWTTIEEK